MPLSLCRFPVQLEPALPARLVRLDDLLAPTGTGDEGTQGEGHPNRSGTTGDWGCQQAAEPLHDALPILLVGRTLDLGGTFTPFHGPSVRNGSQPSLLPDLASTPARCIPSSAS